MDKRKREKIILFAIMAASFLLRLVYCFYVSYDVSPHDLGAPIKAGSSWYMDGHIGYVQYIYKNACLPQCDPRTLWSYYNPPLYYVIAAAFLKINSLFGLSMAQMLENLQLLTMLFATFAIYTGYKILQEAGIKGRALTVSFAVVAFHPYFIIGGVTLNNDMLSILFLFLAILYSIRWYNKPRLRTIIALALCIGLGMMTKLSVGVISLPVAVIFLVTFIKEKKYVSMIKQFFVFGVICIPLGLYWSIRNAIRYGMPLVYVQSLGEDSPQLIRTELIFRINPFEFGHVWNPYVEINPDTNYNVWTQLWKTAVFDEQSVTFSDTVLVAVSRILLYSSMFLGVAGLLLGIYGILRNRKRRSFLDWMGTFTYVVFIGSYIKFCVQFPVVCSMNFRYVVPVLLLGAIRIGQYLQQERTGRYSKRILESGTILFAASSVILYGVLKF